MSCLILNIKVTITMAHQSHWPLRAPPHSREKRLTSSPGRQTVQNQNHYQSTIGDELFIAGLRAVNDEINQRSKPLDLLRN